MRAAPPPSRRRSSSLRELFDQMAHVRRARGGVHGYFRGEKSVGSRKSESTFCTILPSFSESAATFFHSGSLLNAAQFFGGFAAGVHDQIDQRVLGKFRVLRDPVADAFDAVAFEDLDGVVAEAGFEGFEFAFVAVVGAKFVDARGVGQGDRPRLAARKAKKFSGHEDSVA